MAKKRWRDLSTTQRRVIVAVAVVEAGLKAAMLADLRRRTPDQVNGPRWLWAASTVINSGGLLPAAYFLKGRKR